MAFPRIHADFNNQLANPSSPDLNTLVLTTYGTLRDLSEQRLRLHDGLVLTFYSDSTENEDLEVEGTVRFERGVLGSHRGCWVADYIGSALRHVPATPLSPLSQHPCFGCGANLAPMFMRDGRSEESRCPECGVAVMAPVLPPDGA